MSVERTWKRKGGEDHLLPGSIVDQIETFVAAPEMDSSIKNRRQVRMMYYTYRRNHGPVSGRPHIGIESQNICNPYVLLLSQHVHSERITNAIEMGSYSQRSNGQDDADRDFGTSLYLDVP